MLRNTPLLLIILLLASSVLSEGTAKEEYKKLKNDMVSGAVIKACKAGIKSTHTHFQKLNVHETFDDRMALGFLNKALFALNKCNNIARISF